MEAPVPVEARATRRFYASPERVFDIWLDQETWRDMLSAARENTTLGPLVHLESDAHIGGSYSQVEMREGEELVTTGEYLELDRPRRIVFTWARPQSAPEVDRVIVEIEQARSGCELTVTHEVHPKYGQYAGRTAALWAFFLDRIAGVLGEAGEPAGTDYPWKALFKGE
jgi:uncharacterized protein YndB with AHSA1/START domain